MRLVPRIVHAGDHLLSAVTLARHLADDHVVLVVARDRDDEIGWPGDARALEDEELGRVTDDRGVLALLLELDAPIPPLLDERHLVSHATQRTRQVRADLAGACNEDEHQEAAAGARAGLTVQDLTASDRTSIAVEVGETVRSPSVA